MRRVSLETTAVVTMEMQRGVCGDLASIEPLGDAMVERGIAPCVGRLVVAARQAGLTIVHCTFSLRPDRLGTDMSLPLLRAAQSDPSYLLEGTAPTELLPEIVPDSSDIICNRHHGVSPFAGTDLDATLRRRGIDTVVVAGVSLNVGITGLAIEAVNHGYKVLVASDAVIGVPVAYGDDVLRNSLAPIATLAKVDDLIAALAQ